MISSEPVFMTLIFSCDDSEVLRKRPAFSLLPVKFNQHSRGPREEVAQPAIDFPAECSLPSLLEKELLHGLRKQLGKPVHVVVRSEPPPPRSTSITFFGKDKVVGAYLLIRISEILVLSTLQKVILSIFLN